MADNTVSSGWHMTESPDGVKLTVYGAVRVPSSLP